MNDLRDYDIISFEQAIPQLVEAYRRRLEEDPFLVLKHWRKRIEKRTESVKLAFYDDDYAILVPK